MEGAMGSVVPSYYGEVYGVINRPGGFVDWVKAMTDSQANSSDIIVRRY